MIIDVDDLTEDLITVNGFQHRLIETIDKFNIRLSEFEVMKEPYHHASVAINPQLELRLVFIPDGDDLENWLAIMPVLAHIEGGEVLSSEAYIPINRCNILQMILDEKRKLEELSVSEYRDDLRNSVGHRP